jgi:hypothetical protein
VPLRVGPEILAEAQRRLVTAIAEGLGDPVGLVDELVAQVEVAVLPAAGALVGGDRAALVAARGAPGDLRVVAQRLLPQRQRGRHDQRLAVQTHAAVLGDDVTEAGQLPGDERLGA